MQYAYPKISLSAKYGGGGSRNFVDMAATNSYLPLKLHFYHPQDNRIRRKLFYSFVFRTFARKNNSLLNTTGDQARLGFNGKNLNNSLYLNKKENKFSIRKPRKRYLFSCPTIERVWGASILE